MKHLLRYILSIGTGIGIGGYIINKKVAERYRKIKQTSDKHLKMFLLMNQWVNLKQESKNIISYFLQNGYYTIAIYGMSYIGETLLKELKNSEICVLYGIDSKADDLYADIEILKPQDKLPIVDAVVVTAFDFFYEVKEMLEDDYKINCPILSIKDILDTI